MMGSIATAALGLGAAPLAKKVALEAGASPLPLALATVSMAGVIAWVAWLRGRGLDVLRSISRSTWLHVAVVGTLGSAAVSLLAVLALTQTSATNRGVFQAMYPVATAIAARLMLGERPGRFAYFVIGLMTLGLLAMNAEGGTVKMGLSFWLLAATLPLIGFADVYARRSLDGADAGFVSAGRLLFGALALGLALAVYAPLRDQPIDFGLQNALPWILAAGLATAAGLLGFYRAMDRAGASLAAAFVGTAPAVTLLGEWLLLGTGFTVVQLVGVVTVVAGAVALALRR